MELRIGINLDDVMVEGGQIYGDGVNVAARLEILPSQGIYIPGTVPRAPRQQTALRHVSITPILAVRCRAVIRRDQLFIAGRPAFSSFQFGRTSPA